MVSMNDGEQRHGGDDGRADGEALGDGLGGVADRVEAHHDPLGLAAELARHLGDAGGVVGHRTERVLGDDDAGGGEHAHAGEGHQVEGELDVAVAERDRDAERGGDRDDRVDGGLEARADAREHRGGGAGAGRLGDLLDGRRLGGREVLGEAADAPGRGRDPTTTAPKHFQPVVAVVVADVERGRRRRADHGEDAGGEEAAVDRRHGRLVLVGGPHGEHADDRAEHADGARGEREDAGRARGSAPIDLKAATPRMIEATSVTS